MNEEQTQRLIALAIRFWYGAEGVNDQSMNDLFRSLATRDEAELQKLVDEHVPT